MSKKSTEREGAEETRVIDATTGPPGRPPVDPAIDALAAEQAGAAHAGEYDRHSFIEGVIPGYPRFLRARLSARQARTEIEQLDEEELAADNVRRAAGNHREAAEDHARLEEQASDQETLCDSLAVSLEARRAGHRRNEPVWITRAWSIGVVVVAFVLEVPWSYFALQELGESTAATVAMAGVFGATGVVLAELCGVFAAKLRDGEVSRRGLAAAIAGSVTVLGMLGFFLATVRTAYLAAPITGPGGVRLPSGLATFHLGRPTVLVGWLAVNVGMWIAVAVIGFFHYAPELASYQRARGARDELRRALVVSATRLTDTEVALADAKQRMANVALKWGHHRDELGAEEQTHEHCWAAGLAHAKADPAFTTALEAHRVDPLAPPAGIAPLRSVPDESGSDEERPA